ncbi:MAG: tRNA (adenosine(37)-N6)-threonylcarbamoyltransferase complex ATPase subunit type 1 TsaE [Gemmatimonadetes bacterium]|nr:tRNA (adenosine(37)-N6)-threonylcarbamoyltransferase complex ATPase subunit type 1 TsaE [Gemmatimonadota bacterium]
MAAWGREFAGNLVPPAVVGLSGELGTGKTTLIRALAGGLGVAEPVTSPTFALVHPYAGAGVTVYHVDGYRLRRPEEALDIGLDDMLAETNAVVLIEWPERFGTALPPLTHHIRLAYVDQPGLRWLECR